MLTAAAIRSAHARDGGIASSGVVLTLSTPRETHARLPLSTSNASCSSSSNSTSPWRGTVCSISVRASAAARMPKVVLVGSSPRVRAQPCSLFIGLLTLSRAKPALPTYESSERPSSSQTEEPPIRSDEGNRFSWVNRLETCSWKFEIGNVAQSGSLGHMASTHGHTRI